jgi:hypothetical protein
MNTWTQIQAATHSLPRAKGAAGLLVMMIVHEMGSVTLTFNFIETRVKPFHFTSTASLRETRIEADFFAQRRKCTSVFHAQNDQIKTLLAGNQKSPQAPQSKKPRA